jgi:single-stranded-DNA-specific exonuclease
MAAPPSELATDTPPAWLGVERSASGRRWRERPADERIARAIAQRLELPEIVARLLAARGLDAETAPSFLEPRLREALPDPAHLKDMEKAARRLADAVEAGERIAVFGDYDVDGATSAALLYRYLAGLGAPPVVYIPDRLKEGYGPNAPALLKLAAEGAKIVVTVDCGILAHAPLAAAAAAGLHVIVVDHHAAEPALPPAFAAINPNRLDETSPHKTLAAVGVAFLLLVALNRELRRRGRFGPGAEPDLIELLDLVALGTICDVVPLTGLNRALVAQGLKVMARRANAGIAALAEAARINEPIGAFHSGFLLGPRVNAGGRVGESTLGWRLLATDDPAEARKLAERLDAHNRERQAIEAEVLAQAVVRAEEQAALGRAVVTVAGSNWHPGVVGIVASRIVERIGRPVCVVGIVDGAGGPVGKGSGRSIPGADLGAAVIAAYQAGLLVNGGGHKMAAGFTVAEDKIEAFAAFLAERLAAPVAAAGGTPALIIDAALAPDGATRDLLAALERLAPFGVGNAEPRLVLAAARIAYVDTVGGREREAHLRCAVARERGGRLNSIAFRAAGTPLGATLLANRGGALHLAGHLRADRWNGRDDVQFVIEDAAPVRG